MPLFWVYVYNDKTKEWTNRDHAVMAVHRDSITVLINESLFDAPFNRIKFSRWQD